MGQIWRSGMSGNWMGLGRAEHEWDDGVERLAF